MMRPRSCYPVWARFLTNRTLHGSLVLLSCRPGPKAMVWCQFRGDGHMWGWGKPASSRPSYSLLQITSAWTPHTTGFPSKTPPPPKVPHVTHTTGQKRGLPLTPPDRGCILGVPAHCLIPSLLPQRSSSPHPHHGCTQTLRPQPTVWASPLNSLHRSHRLHPTTLGCILSQVSLWSPAPTCPLHQTCARSHSGGLRGAGSGVQGQSQHISPKGCPGGSGEATGSPRSASPQCHPICWTLGSQAPGKGGPDTPSPGSGPQVAPAQGHTTKVLGFQNIPLGTDLLLLMNPTKSRKVLGFLCRTRRQESG